MSHGIVIMILEYRKGEYRQLKQKTLGKSFHELAVLLANNRIRAIDDAIEALKSGKEVKDGME